MAERLSFDPHGQRRQSDWLPAPFPLSGQETPRGFTGHEHLDGVGLIHMNGRVYDPLLGRFLSADPIVQFPKSTQGLNRYTYTNNNPLSFTDPSGFLFGGFFDAIGDVFSGAAEAIGDVLGGIADAARSALSNKFVSLAATAAINLIPGGQGIGLALAKGFAAGFIASGGDLKSGLFSVVVAGFSAGQGSLLAGMPSSRFPGGPIGSTGPLSIVAREGAGGFDAGAFIKGVITDALLAGFTTKLGGGKFLNGAINGVIGRVRQDFNRPFLDSYSVLVLSADTASRGTIGIDPNNQELLMPDNLMRSIQNLLVRLTEIGNQEWLDTFYNLEIIYSDGRRLRDGFQVYGAAIYRPEGSTIIIYHAATELPTKEIDFAIGHEFAHALRENEAVSIKGWRGVFEGAGKESERHANRTASTIFRMVPPTWAQEYVRRAR